MQAEIISIGTEILLGDIVDTNSKYIAKNLKELGYDIHYIISVGDNKERLKKVIKTAINRSDLIVTTGGLGPTEDDLTREAISEASNRHLYKDERLLASIKDYFAKKGYNMTKNNYSQASLPKGAKIIKNDWGTAPGFLISDNNYKIISLPGVPTEMKKMFSNYVLNELTNDNEDIIMSRTLNFFGIGESTLETKIKDILSEQSNPTLALLAGKGEVKLRITAKGKNRDDLKNIIFEKEKIIKNRVGKYIYGIDKSNLAQKVYELLKNKNSTISLAESCTGGLISHRITQNPGSSTIFKGGYVVYSNNSKIKLLNIKKRDIKKYGAVSKVVAKKMAINIKFKFNTDIGIGVTGIAGPGGGSSQKPVGLVYIGISTNEQTKVYQLNLKGDRAYNKWMTSQYSFFYLLKNLKEDKLYEK